jgi:hypothetical protein
MPKPSHTENSSGTTTDSHTKKWFTKISLKIPKKLKNQKNASSLTNALNNAKKNNNVESPTKLSQCDTCTSNQTIYDSGETNSISGNTLITQTSQLTIDSMKNENTLNSNNTPIICISDISKDTNTPSRNIDINNNTTSCSINRSYGLRPSGQGHRRSTSDYINTPINRPRSYSDTPAPVRPFNMYYDDEYLNDTKSYEIPRNIRLQKDLEYCDKTPVITSQNTPVDTSNFPTPSNTITAKVNSHINTSAGNTPVLRHREVVPSHTPENKFSDFVEAMQNKTCDNMTAKEFAMAVGISIRDEDSDSEGEYDSEDKNSICTLSSTLSQLTANGKVPTANEIYNALSIKSLGRQKRKQSAPILNLGMFNPPTPGECMKSASSCHSFKNELNSPLRAMGDLSHKSSNPKLDKRLPPCISTSKSNESNLTCVASKYSSTSSIHSSHSNNTATYNPEIDNDYDSYCSSTSYLQQSMNGSPELNKNNISTTFYSLPRVSFHSNVNNSPIAASKSTNSIPNSNFYVPNCNSYRDMGVGCGGRRHSRVSSSISINSQSSSVKKSPSPISISPSPTLPNSNSYLNISSPNANVNSYANKTSAIDAQNMYINSKTIATSTTTRAINTPSPTNSNVYPTSSSWSNGLNDIDNLRFTSKATIFPKHKTENKVEVYTKGRFTITHETYNHNRTASSHKFEIEKN